MTRVLLIGPYGLGNTLMALPAIRALAETGRFSLDVGCLLPSTEQLCREVVPINGLFARVHALHRGHGGAALLKTLAGLRRARFDAAVALFPSAQPHYNVLNGIVGAKLSVGSRYPRQPWWHLAWLNNRAIPVVPELHDCVQTARLLGAGLGVPLPDPSDYVFRRIAQQPRLVGVHPGCKRADVHKRWGLVPFAETLRRLHAARDDLSFRVFFGPDEAEDRGRFLELLERPEYAAVKSRAEFPARLGLPALFDAVGECGAFIANDSGLMHMAAAQGVRTLGIFGPSDERRTGPFGPGCLALHTDIDCRPCHHTNTARSRAFHCIHDRQYCLTELAPERVAAWVESAVASPGPRP
jgi:ADP-heptose:LPS heptosyltransferase